MAGRWGPAKGITRKTKARKAISPFSLLSRKRTSTWAENCAMAIGPMGNRCAPSPQCDRGLAQGGSRRFSLGPIPVSIVRRPCKPTKKPRRTSSSWPARPRVCWNNCKPPIGNPRPRPTRMSSANSAISRRAGASLPLCCLALQEERGEEPSRARAVSTLRHPGVYLPGVCDQHGPGHRSAGLVLSSASWNGKFDQGSQ